MANCTRCGVLGRPEHCQHATKLLRSSCFLAGGQHTRSAEVLVCSRRLQGPVWLSSVTASTGISMLSSGTLLGRLRLLAAAACPCSGLQRPGEAGRGSRMVVVAVKTGCCWLEFPLPALTGLQACVTRPASASRAPDAGSGPAGVHLQFTHPPSCSAPSCTPSWQLTDMVVFRHMTCFHFG